MRSVDAKGSPSYRENGPVYRAQPEGGLARTEPIGERLEPTPEDRRALARSQSQERSRVAGMVITALVLFRWGIPLGERLFPEHADIVGFPLGAGAIVLLIYAFWSWANPRVVVPSVVRIDDRADEDLSVTLERAFSIHVVLHPRNTLALDPLLVRFVAREVGKEKQPVFSAEYVLDHGRSVGAGEVIRYTASIELPSEAPCTSHKDGIEWCMDVSVGESLGVIRVLPLQVRPAVRSGRAGGKKARRPKKGT